MTAEGPQRSAAGPLAANPGPGPSRARPVAGFFRHLLTLSASQVLPRDLEKSALVFSPHPDDECLGCGGTIIRKKQAGASVKVVHMTDGCRSHSHLIPEQDLRAIRKREALNAAAILGVDATYFLDYRDQSLSGNFSAATERVAKILQKEDPQEVFIPYRREPPTQAADHVATTNIVLAALSSHGRGKITIWEYPVWFWLHWPWVSFKKSIIRRRYVAANSLQLFFGARALAELKCSVNISDVLEQKWAALWEHRSQMTQLIPGPAWITLGQISGGQYLECFRTQHEWFRLSV